MKQYACNQPNQFFCFFRDFREKNKLKGADQYYMASYQSSLEFIDEIDAKKLKIEEPVFEELYNKNYLKYKELGYLYDFERSNKFKNFSTSREVISIAQKEKKGIQDVYKLMLNVDDGVDQSNGNSKELKFLNQQLSNVKLYQLPDMFTEYTEMVDTYKSIVEKSQSVLKEIDDLAEDKNNKSNGKSIFRKIF